MAQRSTGDLLVQSFELDPMDNFGYLVADRAASVAAIIDPSFDGRPIAAEAARLGLTVRWVLLTHGHPDHAADAVRLARRLGSRLAAHRLCPVRPDDPLEDGATLPLGAFELTVLHTPGHTPDSCCFRVADELFTGDTLFVGECGRVDLPGSDVAAMYDSLLRRIRGLPDHVAVHPGHDYGPSPTSTIGHEKEHNYTLRERTLAEFVRFMGAS